MADREQHDPLSRTRRLLGEEAIERLAAAHVTICGLGAVGGLATEALARLGVGHLRLVDFDKVDHAGLNRQILALHSTIGRPKAPLAARRVRDINPDCHVEALEQFVHTDTMDTILAPPVDLVVDAIDSLTPKTELLSAVAARGIAVVSSMGAALRTDPSLIRTGTLAETINCPLAAKLRKRLRKRGVGLSIPVVFSTESTESLPGQAIARREGLAETRGRLRNIMGSLPTITGIFGLTLAHMAMAHLLGQAPESGTGVPPAISPQD